MYIKQIDDKHASIDISVDLRFAYHIVPGNVWIKVPPVHDACPNEKHIIKIPKISVMFKPTIDLFFVQYLCPMFNFLIVTSRYLCKEISEVSICDRLNNMCAIQAFLN